MVGHPGGQAPWRPHHTLQLVVTNVHGEDVVGRFLGATTATAMNAEYEPTRHEATKVLLEAVAAVWAVEEETTNIVSGIKS